MFDHLKVNRAIATRYDHLANSFLGTGSSRDGQKLAQLCPRRLVFVRP